MDHMTAKSAMKILDLNSINSTRRHNIHLPDTHIGEDDRKDCIDDDDHRDRGHH